MAKKKNAGPAKKSALKLVREAVSPCMIRIEAASLPIVIRALKAAGKPDEAKDIEYLAHDFLDPDANAYRLKCLALAKDAVEKEGEIEFDSDATISHSTDPNKGEYILGWVWLEFPDGFKRRARRA